MTVTYLINTDKFNDDRLFQHYYNKMSPYRQKKIQSYKFQKDRNLSLAAGILLDYGLKKYGLNECEMRYITGKNEKPYFENRPDIFFNLSHSGSMVICSFSDREIGADIEIMKNMDLNIARRFFCPSEYDYIISQTSDIERTEAFYRIWVLKECFMKMTGFGLSLGLNSFEFCLGDDIELSYSADNQKYHFKEYKVDTYRIAVCSTREDFEEEIEIVDKL